MATCPTCGQEIDDGTRLWALLNDGAGRQVYRGRDGSGWYVTRGGGPFPKATVQKLLDEGRIRSCYSDCPNDAYHTGKTLDVNATVEERKKHRRGKNAQMIYTDGSRSAR